MGRATITSVLFFTVAAHVVAAVAGGSTERWVLPARSAGMGGRWLTLTGDEQVYFRNPAALAFMNPADVQRHELIDFQIGLDDVSRKLYRFYHKRQRDLTAAVETGNVSAELSSELPAYVDKNLTTVAKSCFLQALRRGFAFSLLARFDRTVDLKAVSGVPVLYGSDAGALVVTVAYARTLSFALPGVRTAIGFLWSYSYSRQVSGQIDDGVSFRRHALPNTNTKVFAHSEPIQGTWADVSLHVQASNGLFAALALRNVVGWHERLPAPLVFDLGVGGYLPLRQRYGKLSAAAEVWNVNGAAGVPASSLHLGVEWVRGPIRVRVGAFDSSLTFGLGLHTYPLSIDWAMVDSREIFPWLRPRRLVHVLHVRI